MTVMDRVSGMSAAEMAPGTETAYLAQAESAARRYAQRTAERQRNTEVLKERGVLFADAPERVEKRLSRLGADWSMAAALQQTPTEPAATSGATLPIAPESFDSAMLGLERLIGRNNLMPAAFMEEGALVSRSVGRVTVNGSFTGFGTGFMVSPHLLLTNNHVLRSADDAARSFVEFNFQADITGRPLPGISFGLEPQRFFVTDRALDFSFVAVSPANPEGDSLARFGWLPLHGTQGKAIIGEYVNIIQHPRGEPKQVALRDNEIIDILDDFLHCRTDTQKGTSGAPVLNDQWEVVALHHSSVPETDAQGKFVSVDGTPWTPAMGEDKLAWKANEGVRISRVLQKLAATTLTGEAARLRDEVFAAGQPPTPTEAARSAQPTRPTPPVAPLAPAPGGPPAPSGSLTPSRAPAASNGSHRNGESYAERSETTTFRTGSTSPTQITITVSTPPASPSEPIPAAPTGTGAFAPAQPTRLAPRPPTSPLLGDVPAVERDVEAALVNFRIGRERPYYDRRADAAAREAYYADIAPGDGEALRRDLADLLERTHAPRPSYKPMRLVYPWLDLHEDGLLRSIYSGLTFTAEELIRADAAVEATRTARMQELLLREGTAGPEQLEAEFDALEAAMPFNCEHVVPQSWFAKKEPMRGDLHHLFACEMECNSFRGNLRFVDFPGFLEAEREDCGMREAEGFEPEHGKGPVARATLYFLLRYPGRVGDEARELQERHLAALLTWHDEDPVTEYELHRNAAAAEIQGNRNPLIDHPDWATEIDFAGAFG